MAVAGVATFTPALYLLPTVYITNVTTGEPYQAGQNVTARACCPLAMVAYSTEPGLATSTTSNPFQIFRKPQRKRVIPHVYKSDK